MVSSSAASVRWSLPSRCALVLLLVHAVASEESKDDEGNKTSSKDKESAESPPKTGPAMPGESGYWTKLLGLGFSEGHLEPKFSPDVKKYKLTIKSGQSKELLVTPMINVKKYASLLEKPNLIWMGKKKDYSPIQNIEFKFMLNASGPGPLDKKVTLEVKDPKDKGGLFGSAADPHKYTIQVIQAPDIEQIVTATKITVVGHTRKGKEIPIKNNYDPASPRNEIRYIVDEDVKNVDVMVKCPDEATGLKYNGILFSAGSTYHSQDFEGSTKSILGQCIYKHDQWTKGQEMQRTYVITVARNATLAGTTVDLRMWPPAQDGMCERLDVTDKDSKYYGMLPGWKCMKGPPSAQFVGSYNNPHAELVVLNKKTGGRYRLWNGIPTQVPLTKNEHEDELMLEAGLHKRKYTFLFGPPPQCKTFMEDDPKADASKPWYTDQLSHNTSWKCPDKYEVTPTSAELYCHWAPCKVKDDTDKCCRKVRQPCAMYDTAKYGPMTCPKGLVFHPEHRCTWTPCTNSQKDTIACCAPETNGGSAPCTAMQCPEDSVPSDDAGQLSCLGKVCGAADEARCCQRRAICDTMKCPSGWVQKYNAALYLCKGARCDVLDRDTCCDAAAYCSTYTCPTAKNVVMGGTLGWVKKLDAAVIPCGGKPCIEWDTGICCNKIGFCGSMKCPVGFYKADGAPSIPCTGGGTKPCTIEDDLAKCCQPAASCSDSNACTAGYTLKLTAQETHCPGAVCDPKDDRDLCCDMVNPFAAAISTVLHADRGHGHCKMLENERSWSCKATGKTLQLHVEFKFDTPVANKVYMGEHQIRGKTAIVTVPPIDVPAVQKHMNINIDSLVAGRGAKEMRLQIWIIPEHEKTQQKKAESPAKESSKATSKESEEKAKGSEESESSAKKESEKHSKESGSSKKGSEKESKESESSKKDAEKNSKESKSSKKEPEKDSSKESSSKEESKSSSSKDSNSGSSSSKDSKDSDSDSSSTTEEQALRLLSKRRLAEAAGAPPSVVV